MFSAESRTNTGFAVGPENFDCLGVEPLAGGVGVAVVVA